MKSKTIPLDNTRVEVESCGCSVELRFSVEGVEYKFSTDYGVENEYVYVSIADKPCTVQELPATILATIVKICLGLAASEGEEEEGLSLN